MDFLVIILQAFYTVCNAELGICDVRRWKPALGDWPAVLVTIPVDLVGVASHVLHGLIQAVNGLDGVNDGALGMPGFDAAAIRGVAVSWAVTTGVDYLLNLLLSCLHLIVA